MLLFGGFPGASLALQFLESELRRGDLKFEVFEACYAGFTRKDMCFHRLEFILLTLLQEEAFECIFGGMIEIRI